MEPEVTSLQDTQISIPRSIPVSNIPTDLHSVNKKLGHLNPPTTTKIPKEILSRFKSWKSNQLYYDLMNRLAEELIPTGATILQAMVVERMAFYFVKTKEKEKQGSGHKKFVLDEEYKYYIKEYNTNLDVLKQLALKSLSAQQMKILATKVIKVIERFVSNPDEKRKVVSELAAEFSSGDNG